VQVLARLRALAPAWLEAGVGDGFAVGSDLSLPHLRSAAYGAFQSMQRLGRADAQRMLDLFRELETNPQSEVVEFKYTRMGPLSEVVTIDQPVRQPTARPAGPIFEPAPRDLVTPSSPAGTGTWRRFDPSHPPSITAADIDGDGAIDLFIAGAIDDRGGSRNAVLINHGGAGFALDTNHPLAAVPRRQRGALGRLRQRWLDRRLLVPRDPANSGARPQRTVVGRHRGRSC
jgi:hypothetical protein